MKLLFLFSMLISSFAQAQSLTAADHMRSVCSETIEVTQTAQGPQFQTQSAKFSSYNGSLASAIDVEVSGVPKVQLSYLSQGKRVQFLLPKFSYQRIQLTETSVWFLSGNSLREVSLADGQILKTYSSYPQTFKPEMTTAARGITYHKGYLYIAHGELGVVVFDAKNRTHYSVMNTMIRPGSMAAAVLIKENTLFVLQGAYHPQGSNGVSIFNVSSGAFQFVEYNATMGVVDPYSSTLASTNQDLFINNSGWIHQFSLKDLISGKSPQAPQWLAVVEVLNTKFGPVEFHLSINGDFLVDQNQLLACSVVSYVPKGQTKPIKEWRLIQKGT